MNNTNNRSNMNVPKVYVKTMKYLLNELKINNLTGDIPVAAAILDSNGIIISFAFNNRRNSPDPTGHAEILAIRNAAEQLNSSRLVDCTIIVTLEPCVMCAGAIAAAKIPTLVFGAWDEKSGAVGSKYDILRDTTLSYRAEVYSGVLEEECISILRDFFKQKR